MKRLYYVQFFRRNDNKMSESFRIIETQHNMDSVRGLLAVKEELESVPGFEEGIIIRYWKKMKA